MPIPGFQEIMLPLLTLAGDNEEHRLRDAVDALATIFELTDDERQEMVPSGLQSRIYDRVSWARTYLKKAGLLETPRRGAFHITERGRQVLGDSPKHVDIAFLQRFDEFRKFKKSPVSSAAGAPNSTTELQRSESSDVAPQEAIDNAYRVLRDSLADDLIEQLKQLSPEFFERLVVDVLVGAGYGGSRAEAGQAIGRSGDEGIDGIIKGDRLGLDIIYIQAKRWEATVGRPEIQKFVGALQGKKARKGVFITTSSFSKEARQYAAGIDTKVVLIAGAQLADLMIDHGIGVTTDAVYELKRIDADYFLEE